MGPGRAAEIVREGLYRGADGGVLLTDRAFAGSDTLATSYALAQAIKELGHVDLIVAGRQAIDGDTAQVGPQVAEKLNLPQVTYVEEVMKIDGSFIEVRRRLDNGVETVRSPLPMLLTVNSSAPACRSRNVKMLMKYKHARTITEKQEATEDYTHLFDNRPFLSIREMTVNDIKAEAEQLGLTGSPTKVKKIDNVVLQAKDAKKLTSADDGINELMKELIESHVIG
jgi:electron transfer flavoprotein beta subunit